MAFAMSFLLSLLPAAMPTAIIVYNVPPRKSIRAAHIHHAIVGYLFGCGDIMGLVGLRKHLHLIYR
jgi:hypothetical protein